MRCTNEITNKKNIFYILLSYSVVEGAYIYFSDIMTIDCNENSLYRKQRREPCSTTEMRQLLHCAASNDKS